jgi:hypothetical protein
MCVDGIFRVVPFIRAMPSTDMARRNAATEPDFTHF